jgi:hypothetical protein
MRRVEEEEEFVMATKRLKSNKSTSALRAVSRLKNGEGRIKHYFYSHNCGNLRHLS